MSELGPNASEVLARIQSDPDGAANLRRARWLVSVSRTLRALARRRGISVREMASLMETSPSQVQRMFSNKAPANMTLDSVYRAAEAMGVVVELRFVETAEVAAAASVAAAQALKVEPAAG